MFDFLFGDPRVTQVLKSLDMAPPTPPDFSISLAQKVDEYIEAGKLVYDSLQRRKIPFTNENALRLIPQMIAPTTSVIVAKSGAKVVGTATVIQQNPLGFPCQSITNNAEWDSFVAWAHGPIGEVANLAVGPEFVGKPASVFFPLAAYIIRFATERLKLDAVTIAIQPNLYDFYRSIFGFELLADENPRPFLSLGNIMALPMKVSAKTFADQAKKRLGRFPQSQTLLSLFIEKAYSDPRFQIPAMTYSSNVTQPKSASILEELFIKQTTLLSKLPVEMKSTLSQLYPSTDDYRWVFETDPRISKRKTRRFLTNLATEIFKDGNSLSPGLILDVSESGLRFQANKPDLPIKVGDILSISVSLSENTETAIKAKVMWNKTSDRSYGLEIVEYDSRYLQYIRWLKQM